MGEAGLRFLDVAAPIQQHTAPAPLPLRGLLTRAWGPKAGREGCRLPP